jgi:hypothetical protein
LELLPEACVTAPGYGGTSPAADDVAAPLGASVAAEVAAAFDWSDELDEDLLLQAVTTTSAATIISDEVRKRIEISLQIGGKVAPDYSNHGRDREGSTLRTSTERS